MNISQAAAIYHILEKLPEDHPFFDADYTKHRCLDPVRLEGLSFAAWYTNEKQYHWSPSRFRRTFLDEALAARGPNPDVEG